MHGWLLMEGFDLPCVITRISFDEGALAEPLPQIAPGRTVPCLQATRPAPMCSRILRSRSPGLPLRRCSDVASVFGVAFVGGR